MTEKEKQERIKAKQEEIEEVKYHRTPSGREDSLAIEVVGAIPKEKTLEIDNNIDGVVRGEKNGAIPVIDDTRSEKETEKKQTKEIGD